MELQFRDKYSHFRGNLHHSVLYSVPEVHLTLINVRQPPCSRYYYSRVMLLMCNATAPTDTQAYTKHPLCVGHIRIHAFNPSPSGLRV